MALPNQLKSARLTNATPGSSIDDEIGNLEKAICDILGIPIDTNINNALLSVVSGGIKTLQLADSGLDPVSAGALQRNGDKLMWHNGERPVELQPAGEFKWFGGSTGPAGWLLCDGSAISRTAYARLFAALGTAHGVGDGSTTFNLPNIKGRGLVGQDAGDASFLTRGQTGGASTVTPASHSHTLSNHFHGQQGTFTTTVAASTGLVAGGGLAAMVNHSHDVTISGPTGGPSADTTNTHTPAAQSVLQPYVVENCYVST